VPPPGGAPTVAVVGGGVTGLVAAREVTRAGGRAVLIEAAERLGGKILTGELEGQVAEAGPDSFVNRDPDAAGLCVEVGLGDDLVEPAAFGAHLWAADGLHELPAGFVLGFPAGAGSLLAASILSRRGTARALAELLAPRRLSGGDVSIGDFTRRRFGSELLERVVDPILAGTRAGDASELSLAAAAPQIDAVARSHPSVTLGLGRALRRGEIPAGPPRFLGIRGGMGRLVERLGAELAGAEVRTESAATKLSDGGAGLVVTLDGGAQVRAQGVILAVPTWAAAGLVAAISPRAAAELRRITYASVALVTLVYPPGAGRLPATGSGILVPRRAGRVIAGCTWTSRKWPESAPPDGGLQVRCFVGRAGRDPALDLDDAELAAKVGAELGAALGLAQPARAAQVVRWDDAVPQYLVGHNERVARIESALAPWPAVALAGAGYRGSGVPECIAQGRAAARRVLEAARAPVENARR
jgi:protoporphyrinogen/coproporphyrinogen III oxidase